MLEDLEDLENGEGDNGLAELNKDRNGIDAIIDYFTAKGIRKSFLREDPIPPKSFRVFVNKENAINYFNARKKQLIDLFDGINQNVNVNDF